MTSLENVNFTKFKARIRDLHKKYQFPGLSINIFQNGKSYFRTGFGYRNIAGKTPMTADTLYGIGSISKSFTAMAILQLVEQGKLALSDTPNEYVPFIESDNGNPITIHHLLSHSSGIPEIGSCVTLMLQSMRISNPYLNSLQVDFEKDVRDIQNWVRYPPSTHFFYNNDLYTILGKIIENLSGTTYENYIKQNILIPLNIKRSGLTQGDILTDPLQDMITPYLAPNLLNNNVFFESAYPYERMYNPHGGIISSVSEMQNYVGCLMGGGLFNGVQVLQEDSVKKLFSPATNLHREQSEKHYCYGWRREKLENHVILGHAGDIVVSSSGCDFELTEKIGVVTGMNTSLMGIPSMLSRGFLLQILGYSNSEAFPKEFFQDQLQEIMGTYAAYNKVMTLDLTLEDGVLVAKTLEFGTLSSKYILYPLNPPELLFGISNVLEPPSDPIKFTIDPSGDIYVNFMRYLLKKYS